MTQLPISEHLLFYLSTQTESGVFASSNYRGGTIVKDFQEALVGKMWELGFSFLASKNATGIFEQLEF